MAKDKSQIVNDIAFGLLSNKRKTYNWGQFIALLNSLSQEDKDLIVKQFSDGNQKRFSRIIFDKIHLKMHSDSIDEANAMLADDNATLDDMQKFI